MLSNKLRGQSFSKVAITQGLLGTGLLLWSDCFFIVYCLCLPSHHPIKLSYLNPWVSSVLPFKFSLSPCWGWSKLATEWVWAAHWGYPTTAAYKSLCKMLEASGNVLAHPSLKWRACRNYLLSSSWVALVRWVHHCEKMVALRSESFLGFFSVDILRFLASGSLAWVSPSLTNTPMHWH